MFDALAEVGWDRSQLQKLAGLNLIRVFKAVEDVRDSLVKTEPYDIPIPDEDLEKALQIETCRSDYTPPSSVTPDEPVTTLAPIPPPEPTTKKE